MVKVTEERVRFTLTPLLSYNIFQPDMMTGYQNCPINKVRVSLFSHF